MTPEQRLKTNLARGILVDPEDEHLLREHLWSIGRGYAYRRGPMPRQQIVRLHRAILACDGQVDHRNRNRLDNRRANLRSATSTEQRHNSKKRSNTTSRFKGVYWDRHKKRWRARICVDEKYRSLGRFRTEEEAARAYDRAAIVIFGEFAATNAELSQ